SERDSSQTGQGRESAAHGIGCDYHASMIRQQWRVAVLLLMVVAQAPNAAQAPSSSIALTDVKRLKCTFPLVATGNWEKGVPSAEVTKTTLSMQFDAIDAQEGTANVVDVSSSSAGAPH